MIWLVFLATAFATYRVGRMIAEEDGPAFIFRRLRDRFTDEHSSLAVGLRCVYCVSFWAALPLSLLACITGPLDIWLWPLWWLGAAGLAVKIHEFWRRG